MKHRDLFLSAVMDRDGTVNVGYLVLFRSGQAVVAILASLIAGAFLELFYAETHAFPMRDLGYSIAAVLGGYGGLLAGMGGYLWGDSHNAPPPPAPTFKVEDHDDREKACA